MFYPKELDRIRTYQDAWEHDRVYRYAIQKYKELARLCQYHADTVTRIDAVRRWQARADYFTGLQRDLEAAMPEIQSKLERMSKKPNRRNQKYDPRKYTSNKNPKKEIEK